MKEIRRVLPLSPSPDFSEKYIEKIHGNKKELDIKEEERIVEEEGRSGKRRGGKGREGKGRKQTEDKGDKWE